ncbi:MAG: OB-fold nucleic acid binding domain-containing protein [Candidatus Micrarchaeaceae archaeon]
MKISDLKAGASNVDVEGIVSSVSEARDVTTKYGKRMSVADAMLTDDTGSIKLSVWGADIEKIKVGSKVKITNGYVNEFRGELRLSAGKYGKIEILDENKEEKA